MKCSSQIFVFYIDFICICSVIVIIPRPFGKSKGFRQSFAGFHSNLRSCHLIFDKYPSRRVPELSIAFFARFCYGVPRERFPFPSFSVCARKAERAARFFLRKLQKGSPRQIAAGFLFLIRFPPFPRICPRYRRVFHPPSAPSASRSESQRASQADRPAR